MALLQNRSQRASLLVKHIGATAVASEAGHLRSVLGIRNVSLLLQFTAPSYGKTSSTPVGYTPGNAIFPPMKSGGMGVSLGYIEGAGNVTNAELINALRLIVAALSGAGDITAADAMPGLPGAASLTGTGDITSAALLLVASALADLVGGGVVSDAGMSGSVSGAATLTGSGSIAAVMDALADLLAGLVGSGTISAAQPYATGTIASDISSSGDLLTASGIASAVWTKAIEAGYTAEQILRIIAAHAAGAATGLEGANPQFTGLDGTTVRIDGAYSAGTRTIDALDGN